MGRFLVVVAVVLSAIVLFPSVAGAAGDWEDGLRAYDAGDYPSAVQAWRRAASAGETEAMTALANAYLRGEGVVADPRRAAAWYRRAAERGNTVAQLNLGDMTARGVGVPTDAAEAYFWLGVAAARGNAWAAERMTEVGWNLTADQITTLQDRVADWTPAVD